MRKIKIKNKKGFLLAEETLKIIIALIAISFLVYLLASIYFGSVQEQKKAHAASNLGRIMDVVDNVNITNETVSSLTPSGWFLYSFTDSEKPNSCAGENCLCICNNVFLLGSQEKKCSEKGVCEIIPGIEQFEPIKIEKAGETSIKVIKQQNKIIIQEVK